MAGNQHYQRYFGVTKGVTWGTAVDVATAGALAHLNQPGDSWSISGGISRAPEFNSNNNIRKFHDQRHAANFSVSAHYDFNSQALGHLIGAFYGASTDSPSEVTGGQGDYEHFMTLSAGTSKFVTVAGILEDDQSVEAPSAQPTSLSFSGNQNDPLRVDISGVCSQRISSYETTPENTQAELAGMTYPTPDLAFCNGANIYCRINAQGGGALSGSDDVNIENFQLSISRSPQLDYVYQGANTGIVQQPKYPSPLSEYSLSITLDRLDDAYFDVLGSFQSGTEYKAEIFIDGDTIGSGTAASLKISIPMMQCVTAPDLPSSHATQMKPTISFRCYESDTAPTGMSAITLGQLALVSTASVDLA